MSGKLGLAVGLVLSLGAVATQAMQVMRVSGRQLLDSNGVPFLARGIECQFGPNGAANVAAYVNALASAGFNAVRPQIYVDPDTDLDKIEEFIQRCHGKGMVVYLTDSNNPKQGQFFTRSDVQAMIERNKYNLVIDATIEEGGDPTDPGVVEQWVEDQKDAISAFRALGFTQPLTIGAPHSGRYLRALLDHGQELVNYDPQHSLVLAAQMYWGEYGGSWSYQSENGFSDGDQGIREAAAAVASKPFLIQWGLDAVDDVADNADVPYELLMSEAQDKGIGTLWWWWSTPNTNDLNRLSNEQLSANDLTPLGDIVINLTDANIRDTSELVSQPYP